jgi:hypothetical protein
MKDCITKSTEKSPPAQHLIGRKGAGWHNSKIKFNFSEQPAEEPARRGSYKRSEIARCQLLTGILIKRPGEKVKVLCIDKSMVCSTGLLLSRKASYQNAYFPKSKCSVVCSLRFQLIQMGAGNLLLKISCNKIFDKGIPINHFFTRLKTQIKTIVKNRCG